MSALAQMMSKLIEVSNRLDRVEGAKADGELFQHKDTRVPSEPRYELRKRTHSQQQQNSILLLIHKFEKLSNVGYFK